MCSRSRGRIPALGQRAKDGVCLRQKYSLLTILLCSGAWHLSCVFVVGSGRFGGLSGYGKAGQSVSLRAIVLAVRGSVGLSSPQQKRLPGAPKMMTVAKRVFRNQ